MSGILKLLRRRTPLGWLPSQRKRSIIGRFIRYCLCRCADVYATWFSKRPGDSNTRLNRSLQTDIVLLSPQARNMQNLSTFSRRRLYQAMDIPGVKAAEPFYAIRLFGSTRKRDKKPRFNWWDLIQTILRLIYQK